MLIVVSPAKNLDYETSPKTTTFTQPELLEQAQKLIEICRELSPQEIGSLMKISDKLASLNAVRFHQWHPEFSLDNAKQAVLAFNGDVYTGLDAETFSEQDFQYAQKHLRILSGLYGLLKPLDLMQPYRLEMGTKLENPHGKDLYAFWGEIITDYVNQAMAAQGDNILINLASNEYFKSVKKKQLQGTIITPVFKDWKNGQYKVISFFAKKARGMMARYIIQNQVNELSGLTAFELGGYRYDAALSTETEYVFTRKEAE